MSPFIAACYQFFKHWVQGYIRLVAKSHRFFPYIGLALATALVCVISLPFGLSVGSPTLGAVHPASDYTRTNPVSPVSPLAAPVLWDHSQPLALAQLHIQQPLAQSVEPPDESQAQELYEAGQYNAAATVLQNRLQQHRNKNDWLSQAVILSNLSLTYQQLGQWTDAAQAIDEAIALLTTHNQHDGAVLAQALDVQGQLQRSTGQHEQAVETLEQAIALYQKGGAINRAALSQIHQAQTLQSLGFYPLAIERLKALTARLGDSSPTPATVLTWQRLGDAQRGMSRLCEAEASFKQSLVLAESNLVSQNAPNSLGFQEAQEVKEAIASAYLGLGNVARASIRPLPTSKRPSTRLMQQWMADLTTTLAAPHAEMIRSGAFSADIQIHYSAIANNCKVVNDSSDRVESESATVGAPAIYQPSDWVADSLQAIALYRTAAVVASDASTPWINAQLNIVSLLSDIEQELQAIKATFSTPNTPRRPPAAARARIAQQKQMVERAIALIHTRTLALQSDIQGQLNELPPGRSAIYAQINLAQSLIQLKESSPNFSLPWEHIDQQLTTAYQQAQHLNDRRSQSFTLGYLGHVYELTQDLSRARKASQEALTLAQTTRSVDSAYQWQWQLGRLLKQEKQYPAAIAAYTEAFKTLTILRSDLLTANSELQFSFRKSVEPAYRELVDLLLNPTVLPTQSKSQQQTNLQQAREVMEALQVAELENFFQSACLEPKLQLDAVIQDKAQTTAVLYPIVLGDRLEVILKRPNDDTLIHYSPHFIPRSDLQAFLQTFRQELQAPYSYQKVKQTGQIIYDWLIQPGKAALDEKGVDTLIFVLDGPLRAVSMSSLYDGQHFLPETYAIDVVLGLEIANPEPLVRDRMNVLAAGLVEPPDAFKNSYATL
ncbi:MAG: hypothetical protein F6K09_03435, partial [Merismopedia sp. SIO2A8]|nr:hypothetical protein [Merismopedia sp. SIO2A8]